MKYFGITVRKLGNPEKDSYDSYLEFIRSNREIKVLKIVFEDNKQVSGVHVHGTLELPDFYKYKKVHLKGFNVHLDKLLTLMEFLKWDKYISKENFILP